MKLREIATFFLTAAGLASTNNLRKVATDTDIACITNAAEGYSYKFVSQHGNCVDASGDVATCEPRLDYGYEQCFTNTDSDTASLWYNSEDTTRGSYYDTFEVLFDTNYGNITATGEYDVSTNCVEPNNCEVASPADAFLIPPTSAPTSTPIPNSPHSSSTDWGMIGGIFAGVSLTGICGFFAYSKYYKKDNSDSSLLDDIDPMAALNQLAAHF